jgi:hydroxyacylglutathione hydrolase
LLLRFSQGHVVFHVTEAAGGDDDAAAVAAGILFSGDTLFVGGCGKFFEGTPEEMLQNMRRINTLPNDTVVFCAHEYTVSNFNFLKSVDPSLESAYEAMAVLRAAGKPTVPTTIGAEKNHNLFFRCDDPAVQILVDQPSPELTMKTLRAMKNAF